MTARVATWPFLLLVVLPSWLHLPVAVDRWLHNARERTQVAIHDVEDGRLDRAVRALDSAARLAPDDPLAQYNNGTGRAMSGRKDALGPLESAARALDQNPDLAADAWYNLGTARLRFDDTAGAVEALKASLRHDPNDQDAKYNLELALDRLKKNKGQGSPRETPQGDRRGQKESGAKRNGGAPPPHKSEESRSDENKTQSGEKHSEPRPADQRENPLPQFKPQPDMSAQQAASILEAVENLEREQRRAEAEQRVRRLPNGEKDW